MAHQIVTKVRTYKLWLGPAHEPVFIYLGQNDVVAGYSIAHQIVTKVRTYKLWLGSAHEPVFIYLGQSLYDFSLGIKPVRFWVF